MLAKLRLDQTKKYEQAIAAYEISAMLCAFVEGRKHILCIGAEQGDIDGWDDFVIQDCIAEFTHLQIKRQQTDFSPPGNCVRNGNIKLTPLDKSMNSLAKWIITCDSLVNPDTRHFRLELPSVGANIKEELELRNLRDFMTLYINSTTTVQGLENLQNVAGDTNAVNIFNWLTHWCGFSDWEHILKAFRLLEIRDNGTENDIDAKSKDKLSLIFRDPNSVLSIIKSYTHENSAYTGNIAPRQLLFELKNYLLDSKKTWTQIYNRGDEWEISGIHDLENNLEIERPSKIIPLLWSNDRDRTLQINISHVSHVFAPIHEGIFQLALHLDGNSNGLCFDWGGWGVCIAGKVGLTLGDSDDDLEKLAIADNKAPYKITGGKPINSNAERESFAKAMATEMIKTTWQLVIQKVFMRIADMDISQSQELRDAVETRWRIWKTTLGNDIETQKRIFKKMVHPNAEGQDILGHLRIGPKTKGLIAEALFTLLLISVALDPNNLAFMKTEDGLTIDAIGIKFWSGPAGQVKKVREIDEENSIQDLIGKESSDILILSKSMQTENEIYKQLLTESTNIDHSLAAPSRPKLLITRNRLFTTIIKKGTIAELRAYLQKKLDSHTELLTESLNNSMS
jgi:hypothetical protein